MIQTLKERQLKALGALNSKRATRRSRLFMLGLAYGMGEVRLNELLGGEFTRTDEDAFVEALHALEARNPHAEQLSHEYHHRLAELEAKRAAYDIQADVWFPSLGIPRARRIIV